MCSKILAIVDRSLIVCDPRLKIEKPREKGHDFQGGLRWVPFAVLASVVGIVDLAIVDRAR